MAVPKTMLRPRRWHIWLAILILLCLHLYATGVWVVKQDEQGVVLRFGRVSRVLPSGIHLILPYPFETLERVNTTRVRTMAVGFRQGETEEEIVVSDDEVEWLTGDTNIVELRLRVQWVIKDPADYLYRVADISEEESRDLTLKKLAESVLTGLVARTPIDDVMSVGKAKLQNDSRVAIAQLIDRLRLGVEVIAVNIVEANPPGAVVPYFNGVSIAKQRKERAISEAQGYRMNKLPQERARAHGIVQTALIYDSQAVNRAKGAAGRFLSLVEEVRLAPAISRKRLWLDTLSRVLSRSKMKIYPSSPGSTFKLTIVDS